MVKGSEYPLKKFIKESKNNTICNISQINPSLGNKDKN